MADYQKVKRILDEHGLTHEDLDQQWSEMAATNRVVGALSKRGKHWSDLPEHLLKDLIERSPEATRG